MATAAIPFRILLCLLMGTALLTGCKNSNPTADKASEEAKATPTSGGTAGDPEPQEDVPVVDNNIYPDYPLDALTAAEKARLVKLNTAELCPCPASSESLHVCLQDRAKRCQIAEQSMNLIGGMIKASYNDTDILDKVAEFVEAARQEHAFKLDGRPFKGNADAPVKIVEFADFACPHCKLAAGVLGDVADKYGDQIAVYFKQYPLPSNPAGDLPARASMAAHQQGKFWAVHDALFKNQNSLSPDKVISIAQRAGLNMGKFEDDVASPEIRALIQADHQDGEASGITGTPTIYINGRRYLGDTSVPALSSAIDAALREAKKTDTTTN